MLELEKKNKNNKRRKKILIFNLHMVKYFKDK
jgi:hypothetical protein